MHVLRWSWFLSQAALGLKDKAGERMVIRHGLPGQLMGPVPLQTGMETKVSPSHQALLQHLLQKEQMRQQKMLSSGESSSTLGPHGAFWELTQGTLSVEVQKSYRNRELKVLLKVILNKGNIMKRYHDSEISRLPCSFCVPGQGSMPSLPHSPLAMKDRPSSNGRPKLPKHRPLNRTQSAPLPQSTLAQLVIQQQHQHFLEKQKHYQQQIHINKVLFWPHNTLSTPRSPGRFLTARFRF